MRIMWNCGCYFTCWKKLLTTEKKFVSHPECKEMGPISRKLYETLTGIQYGKIKAPDGWIKTIV